MANRRQTSPASLLGLWDILDDATIVTTQGCYFRGFELLGLDSEHLPEGVLRAAAAQLYRASKSELPDETQLQFIVESGSDYSAVFAALEAADVSDESEPCDQRRRSTLVHQRRRRIEFLKADRLRRFRVYVFAGSARGLSPKEFAEMSCQVHAEKIEALGQLSRTVVGVLSRAGLVTRPLTSRQIWRKYFDALNPDATAMPRVPSSREFMSPREWLMQSPIDWQTDSVRFGKRWHKVLSLKSLPDETQFTMMETFCHLPVDFRLVMHLLVPDQDRAQGAFRQQRRIANADAGRGLHVRDEARTHNLAEANGLAALLAQTRQKLVRVGLQLVVWADDKETLDDRVQRVSEHLRSQQLAFIEENGRHDWELTKTLPGMGTKFDRWRLCTSNNAVDLMPVFGGCHGDRRPVLLIKTARDELFSFDPVAPYRNNHNATVFGASGAGKSVFMNMLIVSAMLSNRTAGRLMVVDFAGERRSSYLMVAQLFGGRFVPVLSESHATAINPFPRPRRALVDGDVTGSTLNFLKVFTDMLLQNTGGAKDEELYRGIVQRAIIDTYRQERGEHAPTYDDLLETLRSYRGAPDVDRDRLRVLIELLSSFLRTPDARLFNRRSSISVSDDFVIFDLFGIDSLAPSLQQAVTFLVTHYVKGLAFDATDSGTKYIVMDEVAQLLRQPSMQALVHELYATARKHRTSVWTVTQRYADYVASGVADIINLNSSTAIFLSHASAERARRQIAEDFDFNGRDRHLFESLVTRKGEYSEALLRTEVVDATGEKRSISAKVKLTLSPFDYQLATSDAVDRARQQQALAANPNRSVAEVLDALARGAIPPSDRPMTAGDVAPAPEGRVGVGVVASRGGRDSVVASGGRCVDATRIIRQRGRAATNADSALGRGTSRVPPKERREADDASPGRRGGRS